MYKPNPKTEYTYNQLLTNQANHTFQWSRGTATCSCGWWTLWGAKLESAKRNHGIHRANMLRIEGHGKSCVGERPKQEAPQELVTVDGKG